MLKRRVHAAIRSQSHQVYLLTCLLSVRISVNHLLVLQYRTVLAGTVNLHEVLIYNASCTDIEVTHLRVTHLSVRQTDVFARSLQLRVGTNSCKIVEVRSRRIEDNVTLSVLSDSPSVEDHQ